jgi:hypothetical protein
MLDCGVDRRFHARYHDGLLRFSYRCVYLNFRHELDPNDLKRFAAT